MKDTLRECIEGKKTSYTPIWFMRQAGRYLPEFREIRKKNPDFIKLCLNERLAAEISLQPIRRFDLDAVIIFSDILMIPYGLGQKIEFKKGLGPILGDLNFNVIRRYFGSCMSKIGSHDVTSSLMFVSDRHWLSDLTV